MLRNLPLVLFLVFCIAGFSQTVKTGFADGSIYVKFHPDALRKLPRKNPRNLPLDRLESIAPLLSGYGITKASMPFYQASDDARLPYVLKLQFSKAEAVDRLIEDLERTTGVEYAEKIPLSVTHATPNDFNILSSSAHLAVINAPQAWNVFSGNSNITVAIVDNAVMWTHADLVANTWTNTAEIAGNGIDDDNNGYIDDRNGWNVADFDNNPEPTNPGMLHGTHVAGIAGGRTDNNLGVASIGWNIKIIPVQCQYDAGSTTTISEGYAGIIYAARAKARVINCSWGNNFGSSITEQAVIDYAWNKGCIIVSSAGNLGNTSTHWPAAYNHVFCVAATDNSDVKWTGSNYGSYVDICAPGVNIFSTIPYSGTPAYSSSAGTSMSAPMVSGLAALMLSRSPNMSSQDVLNCISATAVNIATLAANASYSTGLGAGRIDAFAAMNCAATFSAMPPVANFYASELFTCPNTPVVFYDSSVYLPTAWSWTFQGGTPATSTSSNPVVQFSTSGTYSVGLSVSNAYGNHTRIKTSYITVSGPISLPLAEGFQGTQFLPANWTEKNIGNDIVYWERVTGVGGFGTSTACAMFNNYDFITAFERDEMRTPKYDFSNVVSARLRFDLAYARYDGFYTDTLEVRLSTNCGASSGSVYSKGGTTLATAPDYTVGNFVPGSSQWRRDTIDISTATAGQGNVMFSFVNHGGYGQPIYLDNINLFFPTPTVTAIYPGTVCAGETVTYTNTSLGSASYTWNLDGAITTGTNASISYSLPGNYTGTLTAVNGTAVASVTLPITVIAMPTLSVSQPTVCSGSTVTLSATGADTYSWQGGPGTFSMQVTPLSTTVYTVTGVNGGMCAASASATVIVMANPTVTAPGQTVCPGGTATLTATGASSYSWSTGAGTASIFITPSASTVLTVTGFIGQCSDTRTVNLILGPSLPLSIQVNRLSNCAGGSVTITASGAGTYSWNQVASTATLVVNPSVSTSYTLGGAAGSCTGSTILTLTVTPLPVTVLSTTATACNNACSGILLANTSSGTAPFTYIVSGSSCTSLPCYNLCAGSYTVTTSDAEGCSSAATTSIGNSAPLSAGFTSTHVSCAGCSDGSIIITGSGGIPPYTYSWSPAISTQSLAGGLPAGCYTVQLRDAGNCTETFSNCLLVTGLSQFATSELKIYPNPAAGEITITASGKFSLRLYNNLGQLLLQPQDYQESATLQLGTLSKGVYYIELMQGTLVTRKKILHD